MAFTILSVREYLKAGMDRDTAISRAVGDCIRQNVLKDFLEKHGSEVINMLFSEWNLDDAVTDFSQGVKLFLVVD